MKCKEYHRETNQNLRIQVDPVAAMAYVSHVFRSLSVDSKPSAQPVRGLQ